MIKLTDVGVLAFTKLRARKLRTFLTVLLASMLFGVLIAASLVTHGLFQSIDSFRKEGLTSRYIVSVLNTPPSADEFYKTIRDPGLVAKAKKRYESLVTQKTTEAKRLGLEYSHVNDRPPYTQTSDGSTQLSINDPNGITLQLLKEKYSSTPAFDEAKLSQLAKQYGAIKTFTEESYAIKKRSSLSSLIDGKEVFHDSSNEAEVNTHYDVKPPINTSGITLAPPETTKGIVLPDNAGWRPDGSSLPVILPQNVIEQLLKLEKLPASASAAEKFERLKIIRDNIAKLSFKMCYRNSVSQSLIQKTLQQKKEIAANQNNKNYQKPSLLYNLPDPTKCENAAITHDTRTVEEKKREVNQRLFDAKFGKETVAISKFITFKVVGMSPSSEVLNPEQEQQREKSRTTNDILAEMLRTEGIGQAIPRTLYNQLPNKTDYADLLTYEPLYLMGNEDNKRRFVEFASASDAQKFIDEQGCTVQYDNSCKPIGRPYQASLAFSNCAALDDMQNMFKKWSVYVMIGVVTLAALIMWITIGRTIVDGRHETAVFRAIGFKRIDIVLVYMLYAIILSTLVAVFAGIIGFTGAYILDNQFAPQLTAQAQYGFGAISSNNSIRLVGIDLQQILFILLACILTGLLSVVPPLVRNIRRSPISDMRES